MKQSTFVHQHVPGELPVLLLLHGTGGNEHDLLALGRHLNPKSTLLSPRGKVLENGMPRFFRRLSEGVFDLEDLVFRSHELAEFVGESAATYAFPTDQVIAAGYSNGANIAASMMLLRPDALAGAILFRAMVPVVPDTLPDLSGKPVLLLAGQGDPLIPAKETERLAALLESAGAAVTLLWNPGGHNLQRAEIEAASDWLSRQNVT